MRKVLNVERIKYLKCYLATPSIGKITWSRWQTNERINKWMNDNEWRMEHWWNNTDKEKQKSSRRKGFTVPLQTAQIPRGVQVISLPAAPVSTSAEGMLQAVRLCYIKWTSLNTVCTPCSNTEILSKNSLLSHCHAVSMRTRPCNFIHAQ